MEAGGAERQKRTGLANAKQNTKIGSHFGQQRRIGFGMKVGFSRGPVQTLEMVHQDSAFNLINGHRQSERIGTAPAGEGTNDDKPARLVVASIGNHQGRATLGLLASHLWIKVKPNNVTRPWNVGLHHSTSSLPRSGPVWISS